MLGADLVAGGSQRRHEGHDGDGAGVGEQAGQLADAKDVARPVGLVEAEIAADPMAEVVAVQQVGEPPGQHQPLLQRGAERRLARGGKPGQPHRRAVGVQGAASATPARGSSPAR